MNKSLVLPLIFSLVALFASEPLAYAQTPRGTPAAKATPTPKPPLFCLDQVAFNDVETRHCFCTACYENGERKPDFLGVGEENCKDEGCAAVCSCDDGDDTKTCLDGACDIAATLLGGKMPPPCAQGCNDCGVTPPSNKGPAFERSRLSLRCTAVRTRRCSRSPCK